jgi:energy-converting hydrogenase Eha subunit E
LTFFPNLHVHLQSILVENTLLVVVGVLIASEGGDVRSRPRPCSFTLNLEIAAFGRCSGFPFWQVLAFPFLDFDEIF